MTILHTFRLVLAGSAVLLFALPARAGFAVFEAHIDGLQIIPSADDLALPPSTGTGSLRILYDTDADRFDITVSVTGLLGAYDPCALAICSGAHIHLGAPGEAGPIHIYNTDDALWLNSRGNQTPRAGNWTYSATGQQLIAGSLADLSSGNTYFNIHTDYISTGELRGQILPVIPEPSTRGLLAAALIGSMAGGFFRRKTGGTFASTPLTE